MKKNSAFSKALKNPYAKGLKVRPTPQPAAKTDAYLSPRDRMHSSSLTSQEKSMGRIIASVRIDNVLDSSKSLRCDALVDTGASHMVLPTAWKERLGSLESMRPLDLETATQTIVTGEVCGPVRIQIEGFHVIYNEVLFVEMESEDGEYEPRIGYLVLEQSQAGVDMLGHRLIPIKHMDLK